jgi:two-component sensor histidine kinase
VNMPLSSEALGVIDSLNEAVMIVSADGTVVCMNRTARRSLGQGLVSRSLFELIEGDHEAVTTFIQRCLSSSSPLIGAMNLRTDSGVQHLQCRGNRLSLSAAGPAVFVRFERSDMDRFGALSLQVKELNLEIARRKHAEAVLLESLRERELLMRELQHRVKNNLQMLSGMLIGAAREATSEEAEAALRDAATRFSAVSSVQQLLYGSDTLETISSEDFVTSLVRGASSLTRAEPVMTMHVDPLQLPIEPSIPIALVLNELLVNAIKYGSPAEDQQRIAVACLVIGDQIRLEVRDNGPGFVDSRSTRRASGLGLVRALLRQLGGRLDIEQENGARCIATLPLSRLRGSQT